MSRLYYPPVSRPTLAGGGGASVNPGDMAEKLGKLIPSKLVAGYAALVSVCQNIRSEAVRTPAFWGCFLLCLVLTPFYLNHVAESGKPKRNHLMVSTLAFPVWAYLVSGSQVVPQWFEPGLATLVAVAFSLVTALIPMDR